MTEMQRKHGTFWTAPTVAGTLITGGLGLPAIYGYKYSRAGGGSKKRAVVEAAGADIAGVGVMLGGMAVGARTASAVAKKVNKFYKPADLAAKIARNTRAINIGHKVGKNAARAALATVGYALWKRRMNQLQQSGA